MYRSQELTQATVTGSIESLLDQGTVTDFLGTEWVQRHPNVLSAIAAVEAEIVRGRHA
nr:putative integron gene cassette protein [uncultured bacterium]